MDSTRLRDFATRYTAAWRDRPIHLLLLVLALFAGPLAAQSPNAQVTVVKAAQLIDGTGATPIRPAMIRVEGERIVEVGQTVRISPGARVTSAPPPSCPGSSTSTRT
jgi:hypothetical protein